MKCQWFLWIREREIKMSWKRVNRTKMTSKPLKTYSETLREKSTQHLNVSKHRHQNRIVNRREQEINN